MLVSEHEVPKIEVDLRKSVEAYVAHEVYYLLEQGSSGSFCINDKVRLRFRILSRTTGSFTSNCF